MERTKLASALVLAAIGSACGGEAVTLESRDAIEGHNLVLTIEDPRIARAVVQLSALDLPPQQLETRDAREPSDDGLIIPFFAEPGDARTLRIDGYDALGRRIASGALTFDVDRQMTNEVVGTLDARRGPGSIVRVGSARVAIQSRDNGDGGLDLFGRYLDPDGFEMPMPFDPPPEWTVDEHGYFEDPREPGFARLFPLVPFGEDILVGFCAISFAGGREYRYCRKRLELLPAPGPIADISVGANTCVLKTTGETYCWGADPTIIAPLVQYLPGPTLLPGGHVFRALSGGSISCGIDAASDAYCWGFGPLGDGTLTSSFTPLKVASFNFQSIGCSIPYTEQTTCGVTANGEVACWGANSTGQLGNGTSGQFYSFQHPNPALVLGGVHFASVSAGWSHTCGLDTSQALVCWGDGSRGQLGYATGIVTSPQASQLGPFEQVVTGRWHTCVRDRNGAVSCFGTNGAGVLGAGEPVTINRAQPVEVDGQHVFVRLAGGTYTNCAIDSAGRGWCWGDNDPGQVGSGSNLYLVDRPEEVAGGLRFAKIAVGSTNTCGLTRTGEVYCWGAISHRQPWTKSKVPVLVDNIP